MKKRRTIRVTWTGQRAPTRAELAAIARAVRAGKIRSGARVGPGHLRLCRVKGRPGLTAMARRTNPGAAESAYRRFHWGNAHDKTTRVKLPHYGRGLYKLGDLVAVEYDTKKGDERAIWVHRFDRPRPSLTATPSGKLGPIVGGRAYVTERGIEH